MGMFTGRNSREVMGSDFLDGKRLGRPFTFPALKSLTLTSWVVL